MSMNKLLYCPFCKTWTNHVLNKSETAYVCGCSAQAVILRGGERLVTVTDWRYYPPEGE